MTLAELRAFPTEIQHRPEDSCRAYHESLVRSYQTLAAWAARAALTVQFAARQKWIEHPPDLLTVGIRDAYLHGLAVALPTGPKELGWAMEAKP